MTNTVLIKRSSTANAVPTSGNLQSGELAINYTDGNLFYKNNLGTVKVIASNQFVDVTGNVTGGNIISLGTIAASSTVTAGNVAYTNVDGSNGQVLTTYGNGVTHWQTPAAGENGNLTVYLRSGGTMTVAVINGFLIITGRSGNINIPVTG